MNKMYSYAVSFIEDDGKVQVKMPKVAWDDLEVTRRKALFTAKSINYWKDRVLLKVEVFEYGNPTSVWKEENK